MPKKDVYASIGTILIFGFILLLLLWLKLVVPAHLPEEQGIEVGYGVDMEGEVGGSSGGQRGDFGGSLDGDFYKKQIDAPSFSEKPVQQARTTSSQTSGGQAKATAGGDDFFTQDEESLNVPTGSNTDKNSQAAEQQRLAQEARAAEQKAKSDRAKSLGVNAFGNSGGSGSGGFGLGSGNGPGSGAGKGNGIGDGIGDGTRGNPFGKGTSNGNTWSLEGRTLSGNISKPAYRENVEGKITVRIRVDDNGNVISATIGSPTTIADESLRNSTLESARRTKFSSGKGVAIGQIVYHFKLR
ncbi:MAG: energy transducer TonB [Bacteroidetes bacterium]|jgi:tonB family C-terminal domain|nr:MAG: energy transducer TonB [Bacteroidota bacterium]